ncbi:MAG TPA: pseudouridine synthase [Bdellovibrionota bacterium]|nr:pseudouridine synthase [Bdellovibrionota bacterium]
MNDTVWIIGERFRGWRLDHFLAEQIPKLSRSRIQKIIPERISVSWADAATPSTRVRVGGSVTAGFPRLFEVPQEYNFYILHEDDELLAVDKPAGLVVHPTNACRTNSLIEAIRRERNDAEIRLVHRLDRETSGVVLLAKSADAARRWGRALQQKRLQKNLCRSRPRHSPEFER